MIAFIKSVFYVVFLCVAHVSALGVTECLYHCTIQCASLLVDFWQPGGAYHGTHKKTLYFISVFVYVCVLGCV